ncbi:hypothetical protein CC80DRAFT_53230 [Byssothecium circinans]|uniref:Uncharacterized protein n=1 Tax=Byssothecium circinans TaxID=147558 RepID=A0A6A5TWI9_9PLEO|nr:hypothetical protein CC80DRAFT_53230 [Byssothecium circinans]
MAEPESNKPAMVSDGKRMRSVWQPGDGNGNSAAHLIQRSINTLKGHPTWKIYIDDVVLPIVRDSQDEPPQYVYLDDRSTYIIWCTGAYTKAELGEFWPFDFNTSGSVRGGRKNRGRPAWTDETEIRFAKAPLRAKGKEYEFCGELEVTEYAPVRPKTKTKMEEVVEQEIAEEEKATDGVLLEGTQNAVPKDGNGGRPTTENIAVTDSVPAIKPVAPTTGSAPGKDMLPPRSEWNPSMADQIESRPLPKSSLPPNAKPLPFGSRPSGRPTNPGRPNSRQHKRRLSEISSSDTQKAHESHAPVPPAKRVNMGDGLEDIESA